MKKLSFLKFSSLLVVPLLSISLIQCSFQKNNPTDTNEIIREPEPELSKSLKLNNKDYPFSRNLVANKAVEVKLINTIDGDTAKFVNKANPGEIFRVRFAGIDTPESMKRIGSRFVETTGLQYKYSKLAKKFTNSHLINASKIWIIPQATKNSKHDRIEDGNIFDRYKRIVGIVVVKNEDNEILCVNNELVKNGYSIVKYISLNKNNIFYTLNENYYLWLKKSEEIARKNKALIWSENINEIYPRYSNN